MPRLFLLPTRSSKHHGLAGGPGPGPLTSVTDHLGSQRQISFLFDLFVVGHRVRVLLGQTMADAGLRPDEYAIYSAVLTAGSGCYYQAAA
jgi:hypothetical protein